MAHDHAGHSHSHGHSHVPPNLSGRAMGAAVGLTLAFVAVEALAGWFAHSLALLSDAGHNLADAAALGFSWYALSIADKPSHEGMTFGYHRVGVFAALANAVSLVMIAAFIALEAIVRVLADNHLKHRDGIFHRAPHWPGNIGEQIQGNDAGTAGQPHRRSNTDKCLMG